jgi:hypothetical protein
VASLCQFIPIIFRFSSASPVTTDIILAERFAHV